MELDRARLESYFQTRFGDRFRRMLLWAPTAEGVIEELVRFGVGSLRDLVARLDDELVRQVEAGDRQETDVGLLRTAMMWSDIDRYFDVAYTGRWEVIDGQTRSLLGRKYPERKLEKLLARHGIEPESDDDGSVSLDRDEDGAPAG